MQLTTPVRSTLARRLVVGALALALLAGCTSTAGTPGKDVSSAGDASSPSSPVSVGDPGDDGDVVEPSSSALIAAALAAGEIDEATALLYRTWLYFGDPQLPEAFVGDLEPYDLGLLVEVRDKLDSMPADIRSQVDRYLLRPADPASAFNAAASDKPSGEQSTGAESDPPGLRSIGAQQAMLTEGETDDSPPRKCETGWESQPVDGLDFRVWACQDAAALRGVSHEDAIAKVTGMLQKYVPQMTADMGELIPDDPSRQREEDADDRIDVYVMPTGWLGPARGLEWYLGWLGEATGGLKPQPMPTFARTVHAEPKVGAGSSSYILVSSDHFGDMPLLERMVVHELFHAFQNARNATTSQWWGEGSAEWAASYYVRSDSARLHEARLPVRQNSHLSLLASRAEENLSPYGAYLWPLFMEQQVGAQSVFDVWQALADFPAGVSNQALIGVLSKQLDVAENFAEFTMRTFNANLRGYPIEPRFVDLDDHFPDGLLPQFPTVELAKDPLEIGELRVEGLGHYYIQVDVPGLPPDPPDTDVSITITSDINQHVTAAPTLEALVRNRDGDYERQRIHYGGDGQTVCVTGNMTLVLSNPATSALDAALGSIFVERNYDEDDKPLPCTRVEATHPETFVNLRNTDIVGVDGTENDDKPDVAPVLITVLDVKAQDVADYRVKVMLAGGTLAVPREFDWALTEFEVLAPDKVYRKRIDVLLDEDLTDTNRDFTIDARLVRNGTGVHQHAPTVELHGEKESACFVDVTIRGSVMHPIQASATSAIEYRPYPVDLTERVEYPLGLSVQSFGDYEDTTLIVTDSTFNTEITGKDLFDLYAPDFGQSVPAGETGTFPLAADLAYRDFSNVPRAVRIAQGKPLHNEGWGEPDSALATLAGELTLVVTKNVINQHVLENWGDTTVGQLAGSLSGTFTDDTLGGHGSHLTLTADFEYATVCD